MCICLCVCLCVCVHVRVSLCGCVCVWVCLCVHACLSICLCVRTFVFVSVYASNHFYNTNHLLIHWMINYKTVSAVLWIVACLEAKLGTNASTIPVTIGSSWLHNRRTTLLNASRHLNSLYYCHLLDEEAMHTNKKQIS